MNLYRVVGRFGNSTVMKTSSENSVHKYLLTLAPARKQAAGVAVYRPAVNLRSERRQHG